MGPVLGGDSTEVARPDREAGSSPTNSRRPTTNSSERRAGAEADVDKESVRSMVAEMLEAVQDEMMRQAMTQVTAKIEDAFMSKITQLEQHFDQTMSINQFQQRQQVIQQSQQPNDGPPPVKTPTTPSHGRGSDYFAPKPGSRTALPPTMNSHTNHYPEHSSQYRQLGRISSSHQPPTADPRLQFRHSRASSTAATTSNPTSSSASEDPLAPATLGRLRNVIDWIKRDYYPKSSWKQHDAEIQELRDRVVRLEAAAVAAPAPSGEADEGGRGDPRRVRARSSTAGPEDLHVSKKRRRGEEGEILEAEGAEFFSTMIAKDVQALFSSHEGITQLDGAAKRSISQGVSTLRSDTPTTSSARSASTPQLQTSLGPLNDRVTVVYSSLDVARDTANDRAATAPRTADDRLDRLDTLDGSAVDVDKVVSIVNDALGKLTIASPYVPRLNALEQGTSAIEGTLTRYQTELEDVKGTLATSEAVQKVIRDSQSGVEAGLNGVKRQLAEVEDRVGDLETEARSAERNLKQYDSFHSETKLKLGKTDSVVKAFSAQQAEFTDSLHQQSIDHDGLTRAVADPIAAAVTPSTSPERGKAASLLKHAPGATGEARTGAAGPGESESDEVGQGVA